MATVSRARALPLISPRDYDAAMKSFADSWKPQVRICVKGYDTLLPEDEIKKALIGNFNSCGEIDYVGFPRDSSCAFLVILGEDAEEKALALDGSDAGGWNVSVVKAGKKEETREEVEAFLAVLNDKNRRFGISVTGFDASLPVDDLKAALRREFASCGEILHVYIPRYRSIGYVYFSGEEALARALDHVLYYFEPLPF
ncbi:unnamed protein product [Microthlaspi erraticum]|uniref:RRM domain-containing protein n=1 Tax=Microthlaspi erraticum TaxID=1685480 RepID=A0A6D2IZV2_9BRAS|nr:unnamed protein product [Microthlaspi erraticum]